MSQQNLVRIQRMSRLFRWLFTILLFACPILTIVFWVNFNDLPGGFRDELLIPPQEAISDLQIALAALVNMLPVGAGMYVIFTFRRLFSFYEKGVIFTRQNVTCYRHIGYGTLIYAFTDLIYNSVLSVVLTFHRPEGERHLQITIGTMDLTTLTAGIMVLLVSWVMNEAAQMEEERLYTV
ncbi:DUF2975 domain-containing protein [Terasakiella sp.]|uniref:DUF2975 domain-containing protein n=1 Tax=Terasakiella sp. TaxID=2034861 RepID=UPI003AA7F597